jgi:hypothetical protein
MVKVAVGVKQRPLACSTLMFCAVRNGLLQLSSLIAAICAGLVPNQLFRLPCWKLGWPSPKASTWTYLA